MEPTLDTYQSDTIHGCQTMQPRTLIDHDDMCQIRTLVSARNSDRLHTHYVQALRTCQQYPYASPKKMTISRSIVCSCQNNRKYSKRNTGSWHTLLDERMQLRCLRQCARWNPLLTIVMRTLASCRIYRAPPLHATHLNLRCPVRSKGATAATAKYKRRSGWGLSKRINGSNAAENSINTIALRL